MRELWIGRGKECKSTCMILWEGVGSYKWENDSVSSQHASIVLAHHKDGVSVMKPETIFCPSCNYCKVIK